MPHILKIKLGLFLLLVSFAPSARASDTDFAPLCGKTIHVGVRSDAPPFAFEAAPDMQAAECTFAGRNLQGYHGFTASLCRGFLDAAQESCGDDNPIRIKAVSVDISQRDAVLSGDSAGVDLFCGATTATVTRSVLQPTSPFTFLTGSAIVVNREFNSVNERDSCRVGVVGGTTSASDEGFNLSEIRLPGWEQFAKANGCRENDLDPGVRHAYETTSAALADLANEGAHNRAADLLVDDLHILRWYLDNFAAVVKPGEEGEGDVADKRARLDLRRNILSIEPYAVMGSMRTDSRDDEQGSRLAPGITVAAFSRYLTDLQADKVKIDGQGYGDLMRACFGRQIDRNMGFLIDLQSNIRKGDFAPLP